MNSLDTPFWKRKSFSDMTSEEWESLCDRCGRCCLNKIEDEDSGDYYYTNVACSLLCADNAQCSSYNERFSLKTDCFELSPENVEHTAWLPSTCAYRLLSEGKDLHWWHPLVSSDSNTVKEAGLSISGRVLSEDDIQSEHLQNHIIDWV